MEMNNITLHGPGNSWDRDLQGLDVSDESENLQALGMHLAGDDKDDEKEEEDEVLKIEEAAIDAVEDEKDEEEEEELEIIDELKELDRLEKELKAEDAPKLTDEEE